MNLGQLAAPRQAPPSPARPTVPRDRMFVPLREQLANVRRWNSDLDWGFTAAELDAVDLTPAELAGPLVVDVIVPYLPTMYLGDDDGELDGVRRTCHELWMLAGEQQPVAWAFDWLWATYLRRIKPVRLLPGVAHHPGIRRVTVDLGAHWQPGRHVRARDVRGPRSASAEVLAAAAHFPEWASAMDGKRVPFVWLAGYQVTFPESSADSRLLALTWTRYRHALSLAVDWADHSHPGFAAPTVVRSVQ